MGIAGIGNNAIVEDTVNHAKNRRTSGDFNNWIKSIMDYAFKMK